MFPALKLRVSGLEPSVQYSIMVDMVPVDGCRYKYQDSRWVVAGKADPPVVGRQLHVHPDSPATGQHWTSRTLSFHKLKLTNNVVDKHAHVSLHVVEANGKMRTCGDAGLQFRVSRVRVRDNVRVSVSDRVGVRVSDGVSVSTFYFLSH